MELNLPHGYWRDTFKHHVIGIERELEKSKYRFSAELIVYLAGMIARELDFVYKKESEIFLLKSPEEIEEIIKQHILFLGQNAIIVTYSKINAEHLTYNLAISSSSFLRAWELRKVTKLFWIASTFSHYSGNHFLGKIFSTFAKNLNSIVEFVGLYLQNLNGKLPELTPLTKKIWAKLAKEKTEENTQEFSDSTVQLNKLSPHSQN